MAADQELVLTVWKDGTWKVWGAMDAYYSRGDPNYLVTIPLKELIPNDQTEHHSSDA